MSAKTGQSVAVLFVTNNPSIGSAVDADATPTGTLYLNGTANAAAVTVTNLAAGLYKAAVTMPALAAGDRVSLSVAATVGGVTGKGIIWGDVGETATASDVYSRVGAPAGASVAADIATRLATAGYTAAPIATANASAVRTNLDTELARIDENVSAAKTLTSGERTSIASAVSGLATTGLAALKALLDAVLAKTNTIGTGSAIVQSPITASGTITIEQGDSYSAGRGRPIDVNVDDPTHVKGLAAENTTLYLLATQFAWTASSVTETAGGYRVRFEPSIVQTAALTALRQSYKLKACIDNVEPTDDDAETIVRGTVVLNRDIPPVT